MLRDTKELESCAVGATDGTIGRLKDLYFNDDETWGIRYLIVDTRRGTAHSYATPLFPSWA